MSDLEIPDIDLWMIEWKAGGYTLVQGEDPIASALEMGIRQDTLMKYATFPIKKLTKDDMVYRRVTLPEYFTDLPCLINIQVIARSLGYAIAEHGSRLRDYDLIAVPWTESVSSPQELIDTLKEELQLSQIGEVETKPHGRVALTLQYKEGWKKVLDLSITPQRT